MVVDADKYQARARGRDAIGAITMAHDWSPCAANPAIIWPFRMTYEAWYPHLL